MEYMECHFPTLHFPLVVLIDYMGFRLMAMSILPIDRTTLVYGSQDGGKTISSQDAAVQVTYTHHRPTTLTLCSQCPTVCRSL
jgi:hypothetical protein